MSGSKEIEVPVLIVGGAGSGLAASIFLSGLGIRHYLVERHPAASRLPKAHYLNQRTMEMFRQFGFADEVYQRGAPLENISTVGWYTAPGGNGPLDRKTLYVMDAFGGGKLREVYERDSACRSCNYTQANLEPLMRNFAGNSPLASIRFHHELQSFEQDENSVVATILDRDTNRSYTVRAQYLVAADGGRTVGKALGIAMAGPRDLINITSTHFSADLSPWLDDDSPMIRQFINPERPGAFEGGTVVAAGPDRYDRHSREWIFHFAYRPDDMEAHNQELVVSRIKALLKIPQLQLEVHRISHWLLEGVLAERYQLGRVFLIGDAAHRHPPTTGLGLNTGIQDAHNLAFKLAAVLKGQAAPKLLDSYGEERQPVGERHVNWALFTFQNHMVIDAGLGFIPGAPHEVNQMALALLLSDTPIGASRRARFHEAINTQRAEFQAHDLELGYFYTSSAVVADGTPAPSLSPMGDVYTPTTRPGHRLPHAWLTHEGRQLSTHDLLRGDRFVLLVGGAGRAWVEAAQALAERGLPVDVCVIGDGQAYGDPSGAWSQLREVGDDGAVLVRPDGHVGWRAASGDATPLQTLRAALSVLLGKT